MTASNMPKHTMLLTPEQQRKIAHMRDNLGAVLLPLVADALISIDKTRPDVEIIGESTQQQDNAALPLIQSMTITMQCVVAPLLSPTPRTAEALRAQFTRGHEMMQSALADLQTGTPIQQDALALSSEVYAHVTERLEADILQGTDRHRQPERMQ